MYKIKIDSVGFFKKPETYEIPQINSRLLNDFNNERKKENFKSQRIFALDFDNNAEYSVIKKRAEKYHLPIALSYETFSSNNCSNFRIVFISNQKITDINKAETITTILMNLFPECDTKCCDATRIFFGGKNIIGHSDMEFSVNALIHSSFYYDILFFSYKQIFGSNIIDFFNPYLVAT